MTEPIKKTDLYNDGICQCRAAMKGKHITFNKTLLASHHFTVMTGRNHTGEMKKKITVLKAIAVCKWSVPEINHCLCPGCCIWAIRSLRY
ncbi:hypothetical protein PAAL109150_20315 [Paenibacillus alkaliterrae]